MVCALEADPEVTSAAAQGQPQQPPSDHAMLAALTVVVLSGLAAAPFAAALVPLLGAYGLDARGVAQLAALVWPRIGTRPTVGAAQALAGPAQAFASRTEAPHTAAFLLVAARRLAAGGSFDRERAFLAQHMAARQARQDAARAVDVAGRRFGPVLGWHAVMDARTTAACRAAHGHNFRVAVPPAVGYPGSLHGGTCRCRPGAPFAGGGTVDDATAKLGAHAV